jgi:hypothetical protein
VPNRVGRPLRPTRRVFTPAEILFEIQYEARGYIEVDIAMRLSDPFSYNQHLIGAPTKIRGLEPGEIVKLQRDIQAWLLKWRADLALERKDEKVVERMQIKQKVAK